MLSSPERAEHREWIGGRILTLLGHYWRDDDPVELTAAIARDWADVLEGLPQDAIQKACIKYARDEPRRKPTPGSIYQLARGMMPRPKAVACELRPATREENAEIAAELERRRKVNPERAAKAAAIIKVLGISKQSGERND